MTWLLGSLCTSPQLPKFSLRDFWLAISPGIAIPVLSNGLRTATSSKLQPMQKVLILQPKFQQKRSWDFFWDRISAGQSHQKCLDGKAMICLITVFSLFLTYVHHGDPPHRHSSTIEEVSCSKTEMLIQKAAAPCLRHDQPVLQDIGAAQCLLE